MSTPAGPPADHSSPPPVPGPTHSPRRFWAWFGIDVIAVLGFTIVGLASHGGIDLKEIGRVGWPFLAALVVVWALPLVRMTSLLVWPTGVVVWLVTAVGGLVIRWAIYGGVSGPMPWITIGVLGVLIVGWRTIAHLIERRKVAAAHRAADARGA